jgi:DNA-binding beta-propeller fold protein YncE
VFSFKSIVSTIESFFFVSSIGSTTYQLSGPAGLYYDEVNQNLYIANTGSNTVMRWRVGASNGTIIAGIAGNAGSNSSQLNFPSGVTLDQWQNIYVNDRQNLRIQLFCNGSSTAITIAGSGSGTGGTSFAYPYDAKLDSKLNLYVVDANGNRVIKFLKL